MKVSFTPSPFGEKPENTTMSSHKISMCIQAEPQPRKYWGGVTNKVAYFANALVRSVSDYASWFIDSCSTEQALLNLLNTGFDATSWDVAQCFDLYCCFCSHCKYGLTCVWRFYAADLWNYLNNQFYGVGASKFVVHHETRWVFADTVAEVCNTSAIYDKVHIVAKVWLADISYSDTVAYQAACVETIYRIFYPLSRDYLKPNLGHVIGLY